MQQHSQQGEWLQRDRDHFPQFVAEEFLMETALKLESDYANVKALLEDDQIKYCYVDSLVSFLAKTLIRYACPFSNDQEFPHLSSEQRKEKKKSFKPLLE